MENHKEKRAEEKDFAGQPDNVAADQTQENNDTAEAGNEAAQDKSSADLAEMKDKYVRLYSDFDNFRRRTAKEKIEYIKSANEEMIAALLPVIDDFERALKYSAEGENPDSLREGMQLVYQKLYRTLESKGLKPMQSIGQAFDADLHEAITQVPAPSPDLKGKIIDEVEKGYLLNDKVIRFAKVVIGS